MPLYLVSVEKKMYVTGTVRVRAKNPKEAERKVRTKIKSEKLQTTDINWNDPVYEDFTLTLPTFFTTGNVEKDYQRNLLK